MRHGREALAVVVGALLVLALLAWLEGPQPPLKGDQIAINLMVVKSFHPDWFQGDPLYGPDYYRYYTPVFVGLQTSLARLWGEDPVAALRVLFWPVGLLFLVGHYALFRWLTGHPVAAGLGALSAMTVRNALGGEYWGFGGLDSVQPRLIAQGLIPVLTLAFLRWRSQRGVPGFFLLAGGLTNLHPVSGFHLAQVTALTHLWLARFRRRAWGEVAVGAGLFIVGALPFILRYLPGKENLADPALLAAVREALDYRFDYLFLPQRLDALVSVAFHAALPAGLLLWLRRRGCRPEELRTLGLLGAVALLAGFAGTAVIQVFGALTDRPYSDIMQIRATKFMYLALLPAFPLAYRELLARNTARARVGLILLFAVSLIPPGLVIHSVSQERRDSVKQVLGLSVKPSPATNVNLAESARAEEALSQWVVEHTDRNDLFFSDSFSFRSNTLRPISGAFKDGTFLMMAGAAPLHRWYAYMREVEACRAREGVGCWFELGRKYRAAYVVVDPGVGRAVPDGDFVRVWSQSGWSLWQRTQAR